MARFTFNLGGHLFERITADELHKVFEDYKEEAKHAESTTRTQD